MYSKIKWYSIIVIKFFFDWLRHIRNIFQYFGFFNKKIKLLLIGLDNAGKSSLLSRIADGRLIQTRPTSSTCSTELTLGNLTFQVSDLGGHRTVRRRWRDHFPTVDGMVFMLDASDRDRFQEVGCEIRGILTEKLIANVPVLILGNKTDIQNHVTKEELIQSLGIDMHLSENINTDKKSNIRQCTVMMCSLVKMIGYRDGLRWMVEQLNNRLNRQCINL